MNDEIAGQDSSELSQNQLKQLEELKQEVGGKNFRDIELSSVEDFSKFQIKYLVDQLADGRGLHRESDEIGKDEWRKILVKVINGVKCRNHECNGWTQ